MLHLRLTLPADRADAIVERLAAAPGVAHLAHLRGASVQPPGDVVLCDVAREAADAIVEWLQDEGVHHDGAIAFHEGGATVSDAASVAEAAVPGAGSDALVWEEVDAAAREQASLTASLLVLMAVATMIAGVGILLDSPILVVGAMVVGPEYGPIAAVSVAIVRRRGRAALAALGTLAAAVATGAGASLALTLAVRAAGIAPDGYDLSDRQLTAFISRPDALAAIVAVLAGVAGMLALTEGRSGTLVGVLVSVTTIPAVANIGLAAAYGERAEVMGAALQLGVNVTGLVLAGAATLAVQSRATGARRRSSSSKR